MAFLSAREPWEIALALLLCMTALWKLLYLVGVKARVARGITDLGMIQDSVGILLALILAFEFNLASGKLEAREALAMREANAIANSYVRCDLGSETFRSQCRAWLLEYASLGRRVYMAREIAELDPLVRRHQALQRELWRATIRDQGKEITAKGTFLLNGINELAAIDRERAVTRTQFVPAAFVATALLLCIGWSALTGYGYGLHDNPQTLPWLAFAAMVVLVVYMILDLDRPWGLIRHVRGRTAMYELAEELKGYR